MSMPIIKSRCSRNKYIANSLYLPDQGLLVNILSLGKLVSCTEHSYYIATTVSSIVGVFRTTHQFPERENINEEALVRQVEAVCNVFVPTASTLDDRHGHEEWLSESRGEIKWHFW